MCFREKLRILPHVFNGELLLDGVYVHYCQGRDCCLNAEHTVQRMMDSARQILFRTVPLTPAANKWTNLGPCCDSVLLPTLLHRLFYTAFVSLNVDTDTGPAAAGDGGCRGPTRRWSI